MQISLLITSTLIKIVQMKKIVFILIERRYVVGSLRNALGNILRCQFSTTLHWYSQYFPSQYTECTNRTLG